MKEKKPTPPSLFLFGTEVTRGFLNLGTYITTFPLLQLTPKGDGHPVLVLPGFLTSDYSTMPLRYFLSSRNYQAKPWELGRNFANHTILENKLEDLVKKLSNDYGQKISIIGWSAGGLFARALGHTLPENIRQIITLGSPFKGVKNKSNLELVMKVITGQHPEHADAMILEKSATPPPVPSTAIYTKLDGVVSWETCLDDQTDELTENVEVFSSHLGLGFDPMVLVCIADRLAQPESKWQKFSHTTVGKMFYKTTF